MHFVTDADSVFVTYEGCNTDGRRFRNTEILTIRDQQIVDVEVYFGWSVPHRAPQGGVVDEAGPRGDPALDSPSDAERARRERMKREG